MSRIQPNDDLISRTAAIKAFTGKPPEYYHTSYIVSELNCLPSVDTIQPRVITLEEIQMREVYWAERWNVTRPWPIAMHHIKSARLPELVNEPIYQDYMGDDFNTKEYGKIWRCWTSYPTDEQRKAVKWE